MAILGSELTTEEAAEIDPSLQVGDVHRVQVENTVSDASSRAASRSSCKSSRDEREKVVAEYEDRVGTLINGTVKKIRATASLLIWVTT